MFSCIKDLVDLLEKYKEMDYKKREELKNNISSVYILAKCDFRTIENYDDSIETLEHVIDELNDLQERIIERNNTKLVD